jgi:hypothetical protein
MKKLLLVAVIPLYWQDVVCMSRGLSHHEKRINDLQRRQNRQNNEQMGQNNQELQILVQMYFQDLQQTQVVIEQRDKKREQIKVSVEKEG